LVQAAQVLSDKPITSIIAGLGIGGLALALASQDSLKHFFGSVVIFADRPFEVGDRLDVDGFDGIVDRVGFRSTRLRTLDGHMVTIPNGELANKSIRNISKRPFIRRIADITITYDTPPEKIEQALAILKELLANHEGMHADLPPRVFFSDFNADSLNLKVIYWYHPPLYWDYMAFSERFNMEVFTRFNQAGIDFAFPTQTIHLAGDDRRPLHIGVHRHPAD
jgi:MscS family membrane protein